MSFVGCHICTHDNVRNGMLLTFALPLGLLLSLRQAGPSSLTKRCEKCFAFKSNLWIFVRLMLVSKRYTKSLAISYDVSRTGSYLQSFVLRLHHKCMQTCQEGMWNPVVGPGELVGNLHQSIQSATISCVTLCQFVSTSTARTFGMSIGVTLVFWHPSLAHSQCQAVSWAVSSSVKQSF